MSFFTDLEASIAAEAKVLEADIVKVAQYFKPLVLATSTELGTLALNAVLAQAPAVISGQEKLSAAVTSVSSTLTSAGKTAGLGLIETAVQAAHDYVASLPKPATPA